MPVHLCLRMVTTIGGNSSDNRACFRETSRGKFPKLKQRLSRGRKAYIAAGAELFISVCVCVSSLVCRSSVSRPLLARTLAAAVSRSLARRYESYEFCTVSRVSSATMTRDYGGLFANRRRSNVGRPHRRTNKLYHFLPCSRWTRWRTRNSFRVIGTGSDASRTRYGKSWS